MKGRLSLIPAFPLCPSYPSTASSILRACAAHASLGRRRSPMAPRNPHPENRHAAQTELFLVSHPSETPIEYISALNGRKTNLQNYRSLQQQPSSRIHTNLCLPIVSRDVGPPPSGRNAHLQQTPRCAMAIHFSVPNFSPALHVPPLPACPQGSTARRGVYSQPCVPCHAVTKTRKVRRSISLTTDRGWAP